MQSIIGIFTVAVLMLFSGCGKAPDRYGNFTQIDSVELVQDAMVTLSSTYPPAKTHLSLLHAVDDPFGVQLLEAMRARGYAIAEYAAPIKRSASDTPGPSESQTGMGFAYVLDRFNQSGELRLTLYVGEEALSRMYLVRGIDGDARFIPTGYWVRKQ